jgi:hypothetical protein
MSAAKWAEQVGGKDGRPELLGQPVELARWDRLDCRGGTGIVDEKIESTERLDRFSDHRLGSTRLCHVARRADHRQALCAQALDRGRTTRITWQIVERDLGAALGKQLGRGETDARCRARDQGSLACEIGHDRPRRLKRVTPEHRPRSQARPGKDRSPVQRRISLNKTPPLAFAVGSDSTISTMTASTGTEKFFTTASVMSFIRARFWSSVRPLTAWT